MLTEIEATKARDELRQARAHLVAARVGYADAGYVQGLRILNGIVGLLDDEIAALARIAAGGASPQGAN